MTGSISSASRSRDLGWLADGNPVDLLVVGGGITGAGVALDAASRGLRTALLERHDLAFGTSRWSSKLVHGGLRYLATGQVGLAYESARERHLLLTGIAPHLVAPLQFLVPFGATHGRAEALVSRAGIGIGDVLRAGVGTPSALLGRSRRIPVKAARALLPTLGDARWVVAHWDGQLLDDARLVVAVARTAATFGARVVTRAAVESVDGDRVMVRDTLTGAAFTVRARQVVLATGVHLAELARSVELQPSRGTHLVLRADALGNPSAALNVLVPGSRSRWVFAIPQPDRLLAETATVLVGLTDDPVSGPPAEVPQPGPDDARFLLEHLGSALDRPLPPTAVLGSFAGLRPLIAGPPHATSDLSRRHELRRDPDSGALVLVGGKLTTYRAMAEQAVDLVVAALGWGGRSGTARLPLLGAAPADRLAAVAAPDRLVRRYGLEAARLVALAEGRPELLAPIATGLDVRYVELLWAALHEGALDAADLLERRTRLSMVGAAAAGLPAAESALAEAAEVLGAAGSASASAADRQADRYCR
jgi:glycerol-3-phosphate dehydrogenase